MRSVQIEPLSSKKENISLLGVVLCILIVAYALIRITARTDVEQSLQANQISAYKELSNVNNSYYADITNSFLDIQAIAEEEGGIPEIVSLEEEELPPYVKDSLWEKRGAVLWKKLDIEGHCCYLGKSQDVDVLGNFLVVFSDEIGNSKVYFRDDRLGDWLPDHWSHALEGWREIVPYTGKEERKKY